MGLFGGSRKTSSDPFQAAVEQQSKRTLAARLRASQSEAARQRCADYFRRAGLSAWPGNTREHPYEQPGLGFYSGEHLPFGKPRQREPKRSFGVDEGVGNAQQGLSSELYGRDLPFLPHCRYPTARFWNGDICDFADPPLVDQDPLTSSELWNSPHHVPTRQSLFPDGYSSNRFGPSGSMSPFGGAMPRDGRCFPSRNHSSNMTVLPNGPVFDGFRPFNNLSMPSEHTTPMYHRNNPSERYPAWGASTRQNRNPVSITRAAPGPPRPPSPPGSYERLRPPHIQRRRGRVGSATGS